MNGKYVILQLGYFLNQLLSNVIRSVQVRANLLYFGEY
jgi:hypothetical protein